MQSNIDDTINLESNVINNAEHELKLDETQIDKKPDIDNIDEKVIKVEEFQVDTIVEEIKMEIQENKIEENKETNTKDTVPLLSNVFEQENKIEDCNETNIKDNVPLTSDVIEPENEENKMETQEKIEENIETNVKDTVLIEPENEDNKMEIQQNKTEENIEINVNDNVPLTSEVIKPENEKNKESSSDSSDSSDESDSSDSSEDNLDDIVEVKKINNNNNKRKIEYDDSGEPISNKPPRTRNEVVSLPAEESINIEIPQHIKLDEIGFFSHIIDDMLIIKSNKAVHSALDLDSIVFNKNRVAIGRIHDVFGPVYNPVYSVRIPENLEFQLKAQSSQIQNDSLAKEPLETALINSSEEMEKDQDVTKTSNENPIQKMEVDEKPKILKRKILLGDNEPIYYVNLPDLSKFVVPSEIYTKGFDASNEFDEEINESDQEFSDDEKEKLYKSNRKSARRRLNNNNKNSNEHVIPPQQNQHNRGNQNRRNRNMSHIQIPPSNSFEYTPLSRNAHPQQTPNINNQPINTTSQPGFPQIPTQQPTLQFQQLLQQYTQYHNMKNNEN